MKCSIFAIGPRKEIVTMAVSLGGSKGDATHIAQAQQALWAPVPGHQPAGHPNTLDRLPPPPSCARSPTDGRGFKTSRVLKRRPSNELR
ncbi:hypothetical protein AJ78_07882 [Emergomyces pasteurianus Ep9510]|uniref:Uncharacterized protein n=1 Tax=Emergomyces pasteurianus Ep9510 TaxID=1447872 RepID=A0A1J9P4L6_9EURO|nr:hypothetical protein AJ78_07882 [Emergomyces pasteurianus Ep9510]